MKNIVIIPARGGSKGIPRKNLRPVNGKPLIYYSIASSISSPSIERVVVSTDDDEIALLAERFGADVLMRPAILADDITTLDPVIIYTVEQAEEVWGEKYENVITIQPTSPLITSSEIEEAVQLLTKSRADTVLSVVDDRHLTWTTNAGVSKPLYSDRVNRQKLPACYKETGSVIACTRTQLHKKTRIGENVELLEVPQDRSVDIDTFSDLALCESLLKRKRIVFTVIGYKKVGLGHVYRALMLAHELVNYDLHFICEETSDIAIRNIKKQHYTVHVCAEGDLAEACNRLMPDLVINDILDTTEKFIVDLKGTGTKVVNFEDLGKGSDSADLVINALYPNQVASEHILVGHHYFCLRDEFLYLPLYEEKRDVKRILLTFGGVDEGDLTLRCLCLLSDYCAENDIAIDIVTGPGYLYQTQLLEHVSVNTISNIEVSMGSNRISDHMCKADLVITSGGRTVFELAAMHVPTIVICQNQRETTHTFASKENGILNLGFRCDITDDEIYKSVIGVIENDKELENMRNIAKKHDFKKGKARVIKLITDLIEN